MRILLQLVLVASLALVHAIYPDDHWQYSTKLTVDTFAPSIENELKAGKTVFVRWIASEG